MKKQILKAIGGASLAILVLAVFAQVLVSAQGKNSELVQNEQGLISSWNLTVTLRDCQTGTALVSFPAMNTYNQGGTMQQAAVPNPQFRDLPGHGIWSHQTGRDFSAAFQFFSLNLDGTFAGKVVVRSAISLGLRGNEYTSTDTAEVFDPNGNLIATGCSTTTASRFE
jgi:hypothetical protein